MARVSYVDLRSFIEQVDRLRALRRIMGADPYLEIGGITEVAAARPDCPALLLDKIKGYRAGFRIFTNATSNIHRLGAWDRSAANSVGCAQGMDGSTPQP